MAFFSKLEFLNNLNWYYKNNKNKNKIKIFLKYCLRNDEKENKVT